MPTTVMDETYDEQGKLVSSTPRIIPDTRLEVAIAKMAATDVQAVTTLAQAKVILAQHNRILLALLRMLNRKGLDEIDDGTPL